jgi:hypothetical protein
MWLQATIGDSQALNMDVLVQFQFSSMGSVAPGRKNLIREFINSTIKECMTGKSKCCRLLTPIFENFELHGCSGYHIYFHGPKHLEGLILLWVMNPNFHSL